MEKTREQWRPVIGYEGLYEVSSLGNVRSLARLTMGRWEKMKLSPARQLVLHQVKLGYLRVDLSRGGKARHKLVHRLVAEAFLKPVPNKTCTNHKNSNRADNRVENLEWCTHKENTAHAVKLGRVTFPNDKTRELSLKARRKKAQKRWGFNSRREFRESKKQQ